MGIFMADPLSAEQLEQIRTLAGTGMSTAQIGRIVGCSRQSVSRHAPVGALDRSRTAAAVKAFKVDAAARRAALAERLLLEADALLDDMRSEHLAFGWYGKDGDYRDTTLTEPPPGDKRALMAAATTAIAQHLRLVDHDSDGGLDEAKSVLDGFMEAVARRANELAGDDPE